MVLTSSPDRAPQKICDSACQALIQTTIAEIENDYALAKRIFDKTGTNDPEIVNMINHSTIIFLCIKYETFTSDLMRLVSRRRVAYNRPWSYTRFLANRFQIDVRAEYERAHDAWEYYNSLKHVNSRSTIEGLSFSKKYGLTNSWMTLRFVREALVALLAKLAQPATISNNKH